MTDSYPRYKLHRDPLSLVLCQVRFSKVRRMPEFIPAIHDQLRKEGFPEDVSGTVQQVVVSPNSSPQIITQKRDEFRSRDNQWSITIAEDMVGLLTTGYDRFHGFVNRLKRSLEIVDDVAEIRHGQIHRIGLRYVDVIDPLPGETFRDYLQESLHGPKSTVITDSEQLLQLESVGRTSLGTMILRVTQNDKGIVVPPDIFQKPMDHKVKAEAGKLITLVDTDHYVEGAWDYDLDTILSTADRLHSGINAAWFNDFVTPYALEAWEAKNAE